MAFSKLWFNLPSRGLLGDVMKPETISELKEAFAKHFGFNSYKTMMSKIKPTQYIYGSIQLEPKKITNLFSNPPESGEEFEYRGKDIILFVTDEDSEIIATNNLKLAKTVGNGLSSAYLYEKDDSNLPAYLIFHESDEGFTLCEFKVQEQCTLQWNTK